MMTPVAPWAPAEILPSLTVLKTTTSLCPQCLEKVPARVVTRSQGVFLQKSCPTHGDEEALLASDPALYWNEGSTPGCGPSCGSGCGPGHSCTLIFEITERCNLSCPTCYAGSSPHLTWQMPLEEFEEKLMRLLASRGDADIVQLSGGEPTLHPDVERMVGLCLERGVRKVYINTNGLRLAREPAFAERLAAIDAGTDRVQLYLQFDGFDERTHELIRGAKGLLPLKRRAIENALAAGLYVLPVMTVTRDVNLDQIGDVIRMVLEHHPRMNTLMLQPAFYSGRYNTGRAAERLTLAEVAHEVARQTDGMFGVEDFGPIPCSHPNCFGLAVGLMREGRVLPISRYFPRFETWDQPGVADFVSRYRDRLPQHMLDVAADDPTIDALLDLLAGDDEAIEWSDYRNFVAVAIKPFMDAHTYDQDRIDRCCAHIVDRAGEPVSFCEYNALRRPRGLL